MFAILSDVFKGGYKRSECKISADSFNRERVVAKALNFRS